MATKLGHDPKWLIHVEIVDKRKGLMLPIWEGGARALNSKIEKATGIASKAIAQVEKCFTVIEYESEDEKYVAIQTLEATTEWDSVSVQIKCRDVSDQLGEGFEKVVSGEDEGDFFIPKSGAKEVSDKESDYDSIEENEPGEGEFNSRDDKGRMKKLIRAMSLDDRQWLAQFLQSENKNISASSSTTSLVRKPPEFKPFSGKALLEKGEISYDQWRHEVLCSKKTRSDVLVLEGVRASLTGTAADTARHLGTEATLTDIIDKFDAVYGKVAKGDTLKRDFYHMFQQKHESVSDYAIRIEGAFGKIQKTSIQPLTRGEADKSLQDRLFHGLKKHIRDSIRYAHESEGSTYVSVLTAARETESEEVDRKGNLSIKAKDNQDSKKSKRNDNDSSSSKIKELEEMIKSLNAKVQKKGNPSSTKGRAGKFQKKDGSGKTASSGKKEFKCYNCQGVGHMSRECPSPNMSKSTSGNGKRERQEGSVVPATQSPQ